ncbi:MAG: hypothetical protein ABFD64_12025 [Armatimonadota bacterium]
MSHLAKLWGSVHPAKSDGICCFGSLATEADAGGVEAHASDFSTVFRVCQPCIGSKQSDATGKYCRFPGTAVAIVPYSHSDAFDGCNYTKDMSRR